MNKSGLLFPDGKKALIEIEKLKERVAKLEQRLSESSPLDTIVRFSRENVDEVIKELANKAESKTDLCDKIIAAFGVDDKYRFSIFASVFKDKTEKVIDIILSEA